MSPFQLPAPKMIGEWRKNHEKVVAVGTAVARRPPHGSRRAELPHRALALGDDARAIRPPAVLALAPETGNAGTGSGPASPPRDSPWLSSFPPSPPRPAAHRRLCSGTSQVLCHLIRVHRGHARTHAHRAIQDRT